MLTHYKPSDTGVRHWEKRISGNGHPYWVWSKVMPALDPKILKSVFYIYPSEDDARNSTELGGTGFFFWIPSDTVENLGFLYAVTCWHVLFDTKPNPVLRVNTRDGKFDTFATEYDDWKRHPSGDDIAVIRLSLEAHYSIGFLTRDHIPTDEFISDKGIFVGDEAIMVGRFRVHSGRQKNLPAAMFGYISMLPDERVKNPKTGVEQESYLVEMRSISGFSGSPVFLWIPPLARRPGSNILSQSSSIRLLGVCWGYINVPEIATDISDQKYEMNLNSSMAAVVPFQKMMDLIDHEEEMKSREKENENLKKKNKNSGISTSSHSKKKDSEGEDITKEDFEDVLRKIARPLKKDEQEKKGT